MKELVEVRVCRTVPFGRIFLRDFIHADEDDRNFVVAAITRTWVITDVNMSGYEMGMLDNRLSLQAR